MMDTCAQAIVIVLLLALTGCGHADRPPPAPPKPVPPYSACLPQPKPLPPIATVEQVRANRDAYAKLYPDCAARLRANLDSMK